MAATYTPLRYLHVICAVIPGAGFVLRDARMLRGSLVLARRWVRVAPQVVDTMLPAGALLAFACIVAVAIAKSALPYGG